MLETLRESTTAAAGVFCPGQQPYTKTPIVMSQTRTALMKDVGMSQQQQEEAEHMYCNKPKTLLRGNSSLKLRHQRRYEKWVEKMSMLSTSTSGSNTSSPCTSRSSSTSSLRSRSSLESIIDSNNAEKRRVRFSTVTSTVTTYGNDSYPREVEDCRFATLSLHEKLEILAEIIAYKSKEMVVHPESRHLINFHKSRAKKKLQQQQQLQQKQQQQKQTVVSTC